MAVDGPLATYLLADHARIEALLDRAVADPEALDMEAYAQMRGRLLRHIGIEEKILLADARRRSGGVPLPIAEVIRREHGAIVSLLVPTPDHALLGELRALLAQHNPREEGPDGLYAICERLAGPDAEGLLEAARRAPEVPTAKHYDGPRAVRTAEAALRQSGLAAPPRSFVKGSAERKGR